jgi:hypothetical protein
MFEKIMKESCLVFSKQLHVTMHGISTIEFVFSMEMLIDENSLKETVMDGFKRKISYSSLSSPRNQVFCGDQIKTTRYM